MSRFHLQIPLNVAETSKILFTNAVIFTLAAIHAHI